MVVIAVETAVLVSGPLVRVFLQFAKECQGSFILICINTWSIGVFKRVKLMNLLMGGIERLSSLLSLVLAIFCPLSYHASSCLSLFLGFSLQASSASSTFMYLVALQSTFDIVFRSFLYKEKINSPFYNPLVNAAMSILSSASSIKSTSLLKHVM